MESLQELYNKIESSEDEDLINVRDQIYELMDYCKFNPKFVVPEQVISNYSRIIRSFEC